MVQFLPKISFTVLDILTKLILWQWLVDSSFSVKTPQILKKELWQETG